MQLSDNSRRIIAEEYNYVLKKMREASDVTNKIYYFSGAYAMTQRILNLEYDPELILIHSVLRSAHIEINSRVTSIIGGQDKVIKLPEQLFNSLANAVNELGEAILNKQECIESLRKIAVISYVASGNGYYLYEKGVLKI